MSAPGTPPTSLAAEEANGQADPLAGDWSEGLSGPLRGHGVPQPKRISMNGHVESAPAALGEVHDAHELLQSDLGEPPAVAEEPPPAEDLSFTADLTPPEPALVFADPDIAAEATAPEMIVSDPTTAEAPAPDPEAAQEPAPTPWSEPVPDAQAVGEDAWDSPPAPDPDVTPAEAWMPPPETEAASPEAAAAADPAPAPDPAPVPDETWSTPAAQPVEEWQAESAPADFEEVQAPASDAPAAAADWSSLSAGPDWNAPAAAPEAAPAEEWSAAAPAAASEWNPASPEASEPEWSAPAPVAAPEAETWSALEAPSDPAHAPEPEWSAPPPDPPKPALAWNQAAVGASALEQLDSDPVVPEPGAAKELFGSVPDGGVLAGDDDQESLYQPPEELASPEEVLRPLPSDDDADLPAPTGEPPRNGPRPQALAAFRTPGAGALEVRGEHRVAIHTRGGRTLRGTVRDVDLSKSQFPLLPQGGGGIEAIYHSDVKAIFFMLAPGEIANDGDGSKVRVTFVDGRVIEGMREGADAKHGFFLVPLDATRTNTRRIYVAREAASEIEDG